MINWLSQISSLTRTNLRSIPERKGAAAAAAVGIAGVTAVLVGVLSIAEGFQKATAGTGSDDIAIVLRASATNEMGSNMSRDSARLVKDGPGIARAPYGTPGAAEEAGAEGPLASAELFVIVDLPKKSTGTSANVPFRGVELAGRAIRGDIKLEKGRWFEPGRNEVVAGVGAARSFARLEVGNTFRVGENEWKVVGHFRGGGVAESEIWTDAGVLQPAYNRGNAYQSVYVRLTSPKAFEPFKDALTTNPQLKVKVLHQTELLADQAEMLTAFVRLVGWGIASLMSVGALFGALNTMFSAVAARTREIATLRALGFGPGSVVVSVLLESLILAMAGGAMGSLAAYLAFDGYKASTLNFGSWSQLAFAFAVTPKLLVMAIAASATIGLLGGLFPAIRAARLPIALALRET